MGRNQRWAVSNPARKIKYAKATSSLNKLCLDIAPLSVRLVTAPHRVFVVIIIDHISWIFTKIHELIIALILASSASSCDINKNIFLPEVRAIIGESSEGKY